MKRFDFLIVSVILIFITILIILVKPFNNNTKKIEIIICNEIIDIEYIDTNNNYLITSDIDYIYIYKNKNLIKQINNKTNKIITNEIVIINNEVTIKNTNCNGKDCLNMVLNKHNRLPIICTNGVVIKFIDNNKNSDIIL